MLEDFAHMLLDLLNFLHGSFLRGYLSSLHPASLTESDWSTQVGAGIYFQNNGSKIARVILINIFPNKAIG